MSADPADLYTHRYAEHFRRRREQGRELAARAPAANDYCARFAAAIKEADGNMKLVDAIMDRMKREGR